MPKPRIIKLKLTPNRPTAQNVRRPLMKVKKGRPEYLKTTVTKG